ncbi:MAG TPA: bifunctional homocysteine S-methyltransferase/methylenetetrahydrofolate reductase [Holophagaceae bacterium]|nr:bifunctional homocysteine S-methyltransferase/methylenetetrahydrofolate reductase [Holophagaceae bacterium]
MSIPFRQALDDGRCFLFDGSTPTALFERGIHFNRSFDGENLVDPAVVLGVHEAFRGAGAQVLTTNTWAANRPKLSAYGLAEKLAEINRRGAELAREALEAEAGASSSHDGWVAGCIGPLGVRIEPWGPTSFDEARHFFTEQAEALRDAEVDLFVLEAFEDLNEIRQAIAAVKAVSDLPVVAMMTPGDGGRTLYGAEPEWYAQKLAEWGADLVGANGGGGPAQLLELLKRFRGVVSVPLILKPSAGLPRQVDGRALYPSSPEYLGEFARQAFQGGARAVGGCSGTAPSHIRAMRGALRQERAFFQGTTTVEPKPHEEPQAEVPVRERSRLARKLADGGFITTVELVPPRGMETERLLAKTRQCAALGVDAVNVPDGPRAMARMSALATALLIEREVGVETILHYACRDRNLLGIQSDLLGAAALGLRNVLAITGDPPKLGPYPQATAVFDVDAIGLVNILKRLNTGLDLGGAAIGRPTPFSLGVGANPVAQDLEREKSRFRWKVDAGAQWAITQPVFDAESLFRFLDFADGFGIPIIAGIWPLKNLRNAQFMAHELPGVFVPPQILERMGRFEKAEDQVKEGLAIAREIIEIIRPRVRGLQLSAPFGQVELVAPLLPGFAAKDGVA